MDHVCRRYEPGARSSHLRLGLGTRACYSAHQRATTCETDPLMALFALSIFGNYAEVGER